jgi:hypothetical protein
MARSDSYPELIVPASTRVLPRQLRYANAHAANAKKVEMLLAHRKRILKLDRLRRRGLSGARDEF